MDQRSLIENHMALMADGWEIQVEMTDGNKEGEVKRYSLSNLKLGNNTLKIVLNYPVGNESGKYELVIENEFKISFRETYRSETNAQNALFGICKRQLEITNDTAS